MYAGWGVCVLSGEGVGTGQATDVIQELYSAVDLAYGSPYFIGDNDDDDDDVR
jgi:hypothetical protein